MSFKSDIPISDHALLRYVERVKGINLDQYRAEIASAVDGREPINLRKMDRTFKGDFYVLSKNWTVVTVLPDGMWPKRAKKYAGFTVIAVPRQKAEAPPKASMFSRLAAAFSLNAIHRILYGRKAA